MKWIMKMFKKKKSNLPPSDITPKFNRPEGWTPKVYILQKDFPSMKKGARFRQDYCSDNVYFHAISISSTIPEKDQVGIIKFEAKDIENNKEWFVLSTDL